MSPFDLNGPAFLLFYAVLGVAVCLVLRRAIFRNEAAGDWAPLRNDPYLIAFLRADAAEAVKLAVVALIDRELLRYDGKLLSLARADASQFVQRDIEREVLARCATGASADAVLVGATRMRACMAYRAELVAGGFLAGPQTMAQRRPLVMLAVGVLLGVGVARVILALGRGHHNIVLLLILMALFAGFALWQLLPDRTGRGAVALADLRTLFARLRTRAPRLAAGGETNEMALLAAVFGLAALPPLVFPYVRQMYGPKPGSDDGSASSSGCGSSGGDSSSTNSCSSSSGGGSSSGCGGGGGCGGCGS